MLKRAGTLLLLIGLLAVSAAAADTGTVSGTISLEKARIKYDGPKPGSTIVVSLSGAGTAGAPAPRDSVLHMDQKGLVFLPHVMALQLGQSVEFLNSDNDRHNVYFLHDETGETLDIGTWGPGVSVKHTFDRPGMNITLCTLHLEMAAYILVFDHPWFQVCEINEAAGTASYAFEGIPTGEYEVNIWHKKLKQKKGPKAITVTAGANTVLDDVVTKKKYAK